MSVGFYSSRHIANTCVWSELFNNNERIILQDGIVFSGLLSVMLSSWLTLTLLFTNLRSDSSYRNMANFTMAACIRSIGHVISQLIVLENVESWCDLRMFSCEYFSFFETFLAVFEVECLTHVCIERYVVAKYATNDYLNIEEACRGRWMDTFDNLFSARSDGWQMNKWHYTLYLYLCFLFSCLYSVPPLFGVGRYSFDFQCTSCTFDMVLPDSWERYFVITIFALRSVKPAIFMIIMLIWAHILESKHLSLKKYSYFTRSVAVVTVVNLLCWGPLAVLRGYVLTSYMTRIDPVLLLSAVYIKWAMWIHSVAPALTAVALIVVDDRVRSKMFSFCWSEQEAKNVDDKNE